MRHKALYPGILVLVVLALSSLFLIGPRLGTKAQSTTACCGTNPPTAPRAIVFPYYSLADGFNSTLLLVSDSGDPLDLIVAVHSLSGQTQLSNSMTIQPGAKLPIDMRSLLTSLGADVAGTFSQGSVSVYFEGTIMPLLGQMTIENPARHWAAGRDGGERSWAHRHSRRTQRAVVESRGRQRRHPHGGECFPKHGDRRRASRLWRQRA